MTRKRNLTIYIYLCFIPLIIGQTGIDTSIIKKTTQFTVQLRDNSGRIYAQGQLINQLRIGHWLFYISPESRKTQKADVQGFYDSKGMKSGSWTHHNQKLGLHLKATFANNLMHGECIYFDDKNFIVARGLVNNGNRHGKWIFYDEKSGSTGGYHKDGYKLNKIMTQGYYLNGLRIGTWDYDYYLDANTHVKGTLQFADGQNNGRFEFFKVENHTNFGKEEILAGIGTFKNNVKTGRWVVFNYGTKGDFIETGSYKNGQRTGLWKVVIGDQTHLSGSYINGIPHGKSYQYYENGQLKYQTNYHEGMETGSFVHYYPNGQIKEQGSHVILETEITSDTIYDLFKLPLEQHFDLVDLNFQTMHYEYINWLEQPGYSIDPKELKRRLKRFVSYGNSDERPIKEIKIRQGKVMRNGLYLAFYPNGNLRLKGKNRLGITSILNPFDHTVRQGFARTGHWKEYDQFKQLKATYVYEEGKLIQMLDGNGYVEHTIKYESNGSFSMVHPNGNPSKQK